MSDHGADRPEELPSGYDSWRHWEMAQKYDLDVTGGTVTINDELVIDLKGYWSEADGAQRQIDPEAEKLIDPGVWVLRDPEWGRIEACIRFTEVDRDV